MRRTKVSAEWVLKTLLRGAITTLLFLAVVITAAWLTEAYYKDIYGSAYSTLVQCYRHSGLWGIFAFAADYQKLLLAHALQGINYLAKLWNNYSATAGNQSITILQLTHMPNTILLLIAIGICYGTIHGITGGKKWTNTASLIVAYAITALGTIAFGTAAAPATPLWNTYLAHNWHTYAATGITFTTAALTAYPISLLTHK